jgi:cytochrome c-type biogenesis protein
MRSAFFGSLFFVIGFSVVFVILGVLFTTTFGLLGRINRIVNPIAGSIVILLGLNFVFNFWKLLNVEKRFHLARIPAASPSAKASGRPSGSSLGRSVIGSVLLGVAFGAGWSPCVGPILGSILLYAGSGANLWGGISLLLFYSLGLGLPFLLTGLFFSLALRQFKRIKPHLPLIRIISGGFLILVGLLILLGRLQQFNPFLFSLSHRLETWEKLNPGGARILFGVLPLLLAMIILFFFVRRLGVERASQRSAVLVKPVRITLIVILTAVAVLSFSGVINFSSLISLWLNYQGI